MSEGKINKNTLVDDHQRKIRKLRVSLLDVCNFRCFYCMPINAKFMNASKWLSPEEIITMSRELVDLGIEEIRVTGGEPTLRPEFRTILRGLSELPLKKFGITSNAFRIEEELEFLKEVGCQHINISLDSLNPENFEKITRSKSFKQVLQAILKAKEMGFEVKINTVIMRDVNDHELLDFMKFSATHDIEVRFLELMKIGQACRVQENLFVSAEEMIQNLETASELTSVLVARDSTSFNYKTSAGAKIGFIASESKPFCGACSRWRLSADGFLRACLMSEKGVRIKDVDFKHYPRLIQQLLPMKPFARLYNINQDMNRIGG